MMTRFEAEVASARPEQFKKFLLHPIRVAVLSWTVGLRNV